MASICPLCKDTVPATGIAGGDGSHRMCLVKGLQDGLFATVGEWEKMCNPKHAPGTYLRFFKNDEKMSTVVVTKKNEYLVVNPQPLKTFSVFEELCAAHPGYTEIRTSTSDDRKKATVEEKERQIREHTEKRTEDEKYMCALYDYYGLENGHSSAYHIFAEFDREIVPVSFHRKKNEIFVERGYKTSERRIIHSFSELRVGSVTRFWYKPCTRQETLIPVEKVLIPKPDQKITYITYYNYAFSKDVIDKGVRPLQEKGYFVYLRLLNKKFEWQRHQVLKDPNVLDVFNYSYDGKFWGLRGIEKRGSVNITELL